MSNLGSDDTPVVGESFSLPAGAQLDEDSGDLVVKDSGGTIVLRRNESAGEWQFEGTDLTGINSADANSVSADVLNSADLTNASQGELIRVTGAPPELEATSINVGASSTVTDPEDSAPIVGDRGDLWHLTQFGGGGTERFSLNVDAPPIGMALDDTKVYFGNANDQAYAHLKLDGSEDWVFTVGGDVESGFAVDDSNVYFGASGNFYAVDKETGTEVWSTAVGTGDINSAIESEVVQNDTYVYAGANNDVFYAFDKSTGSIEWSTSVSGAPDNGVAIDDNNVYFGATNDALYALDVTTGSETWRSTVLTAFGRGIAIDSNNVYLSDNQTTFHAIDITDGTGNWTFTTSNSARSGVVTDDSSVYLGDDAGNFYSLNKSNGTEEWTIVADGAINSGLALRDRFVYYGDNGNSLAAVDTATEQKSWQYDTDDNVESYVVVDSSGAYAGTGFNNLISATINLQQITETRVSNGEIWMEGV